MSLSSYNFVILIILSIILLITTIHSLTLYERPINAPIAKALSRRKPQILKPLLNRGRTREQMKVIVLIDDLITLINNLIISIKLHPIDEFEYFRVFEIDDEANGLKKLT